jgi:hypothetical protein
VLAFAVPLDNVSPCFADDDCFLIYYYRVCAIASRYYDKKRDLYPRLAAVARRLVWDMSAKGYKSVEIIQAFLLQACYTLSPTEK